MMFNGSDVELPTGALDLVYTIGINNYRGERSLQLHYVSSRASQVLPDDPTVQAPKPQTQILDLRRTPTTVAELPSPAHATWYAEGTQLEAKGVTFAPRYAPVIQFGRPLVLYSAPPSAHLLKLLVDQARPGAIYLVGEQTGDDSLEAVLRNVASMCKYAIQRGQPLQLERMAARLGLTTQVIRHSLLWLQAKSQLYLQGWENDDTVQIGNMPANALQNGAPDDPALLLAQLTELLAEVRAYRRYFLRAKPSALGLPA
jgi:hypothetical protein